MFECQSVSKVMCDFQHYPHDTNGQENIVRVLSVHAMLYFQWTAAKVKIEFEYCV